MRPARTIAAVALAAALSGCAAHSTTSSSRPAAAPPPPATAAPPTSAPGAPPAASRPSRPVAARCDAAALHGSVLSSEGAAGTIWRTIQLRNVSARSCTVQGIPTVRLLDAQGAPVTAPSLPSLAFGPGSRLLLRPAAAAQFAVGVPNVCGRTVAGSRLRVTLPSGRGSLVVGLGAEAAVGTCAPVQVQAMQASTA
jgi:hypothetical protein